MFAKLFSEYQFIIYVHKPSSARKRSLIRSVEKKCLDFLHRIKCSRTRRPKKKPGRLRHPDAPRPQPRATAQRVHLSLNALPQTSIRSQVQRRPIFSTTDRLSTWCVLVSPTVWAWIISPVLTQSCTINDALRRQGENWNKFASNKSKSIF